MMAIPDQQKIGTSDPSFPNSGMQDQESETTYEVKLEIFEGPLDLLLHLIHKNEVDIFDIPIAKITDQYLQYLDMMKALNVNVAGEFLVMASTLVHIKSKMLLPRSDEEDDEEDPRTEIMRPLLEYMRFKELAQDLSDREMLDRDVFARQRQPYLQTQVADENSRLEVNVFQLMDAFKRIMEQRTPGVQLRLRLEQWSIKEQTELILIRLKEKETMFFGEVFDGDRTVSKCVVTFLALLELIHMGLVKVFQSEPESDIQLVASFDENTGNADGQSA